MVKASHKRDEFSFSLKYLWKDIMSSGYVVIYIIDIFFLFGLLVKIFVIRITKVLFFTILIFLEGKSLGIINSLKPVLAEYKF